MNSMCSETLNTYYNFTIIGDTLYMNKILLSLTFIACAIFTVILPINNVQAYSWATCGNLHFSCCTRQGWADNNLWLYLNGAETGGCGVIGANKSVWCSGGDTNLYGLLPGEYFSLNSFCYRNHQGTPTFR